MSSSNIIKSKAAEGLCFERFSFETIHQQTEVMRPATPAATFVPFLNSILAGTDLSLEPQCQGDSSDEQAAQAFSGQEQVVTLGIPEEIHQRKVQESYEQGFEEGKRQAERGLANVFKALRDGVEELAGLKEHVLRVCEEDLLKLAVMIARKVIHQEIATDRLILAKVVAAAVSNVSDRDELVIRLNPEDHRLVSAHKHLYLHGCSNESLVELRADEVIPPGGCIVDTVMGEIDARTDSQVDEIFRRLLEEKSSFMSLPAALAGEREHHAYEEN